MTRCQYTSSSPTHFERCLLIIIIIIMVVFQEPKLFSMMAPSMGVFGVVTEAEIQCVPLQILEARLTEMPTMELPAKYMELSRTNKYLRIIAYPDIDVVTVWTANPVEGPAPEASVP